MREFEAIATDPAFQISHRLEPGEVRCILMLLQHCLASNCFTALPDQPPPGTRRGAFANKAALREDRRSTAGAPCAAPGSLNPCMLRVRAVVPSSLACYPLRCPAAQLLGPAPALLPN